MNDLNLENVCYIETSIGIAFKFSCQKYFNNKQIIIR